MRALIRKILASVARFAVRTIEVVEGGVRRFVSILMPVPPSALAEEATDIVDEERPVPAAPTASPRPPERPSEAERTRRAAAQLRDGRPIPPSMLDPSNADEREVLTWLADRDALQLGMLAKASELDVSLHLAGTRALRMPLLPRDEAYAEAEREARRPPTFLEWIGIVMSTRATDGDDDPEPDDVIEEARALAARNATVADYEADVAAAREAAGSDLYIDEVNDDVAG